MTFRTNLFGAACALALSAGAAFADGVTITVSLWDKGEASADNADTVVPMVMGGTGDMSMATMGITASLTTVPAGEVTFLATNDSSSIIHEMIVAPVVSADAPLPYDPVAMRVDEDAAGALGEVEEIEPGVSGSLTLRLEPGQYILFCNIAGHYPMGMWTILTVTE